VTTTPGGAPEEPRATIYGPAWRDARDRLEWVEDDDARVLLTSAMDQVESGWVAVGALQRWAEQHREPERPDDDYGALLTFAESEVQEVYREMASDLAEWVRAWPGQDLPPANDVDAGLSEFGRYAAVLVLATGAALDVPDAFRKVVHQVVRLRPGGQWFRRLAGTLAVLQDRAGGEITADTARQAVDFLLHALPEPERERAGGQLLVNLNSMYAVAGPPPPGWLALLQAYFSEQAGEASTPERGFAH
jgi:hypothetical protein